MEGADIPATNLTLNNIEHLPVSIASRYELSSSLRAANEGLYESIIEIAIRDVITEQLTTQVLQGAGSSKQIQGIWGTSSVQNINYGTNATDFDRDDTLDVLNAVRLAKTDGAAPIMVAGTDLWKRMEKQPRKLEGTPSAGYTKVQGSSWMTSAMPTPGG